MELGCQYRALLAGLSYCYAILRCSSMSNQSSLSSVICTLSVSSAVAVRHSTAKLHAHLHKHVHCSTYSITYVLRTNSLCMHCTASLHRHVSCGLCPCIHTLVTSAGCMCWNKGFTARLMCFDSTVAERRWIARLPRHA